MQNPFVRFKRYRCDTIHPLENHATETLAACLSFSENIRREFVRFLFSEKVPFDESVALEVLTQQQVAGYGIVDLVLEQPGVINIVVETKVHAREDGAQIRDYREWLHETKTGRNFVFSLVQTPDPNFNIQKFGGDGRLTWRALYDFMAGSGKKRLTEASEITILEHLLNYMEAGGIVSNWTPQQIIDYGRGVLAKKALTNLFERVQENLVARQPCPFLQPVVVVRDDQWPRLEIGVKAWDTIFGKHGYLNKLYMYYQTRAAWDGEAEGFYFEIVLWQKQHRNDWSLTASKLPQWIAVLRENNFEHWTFLKGYRELEKDADKYDFPEAPSNISACAKDQKIAYITESDLRTQNDSELVNLCVKRVDEHCAVISSFK